MRVQFRFGDQLIDTDRRELRRGGALVALEPQVFDLLVYLVQNRDRVVSKDDLLEAVWGGRIVSESALSSRITAVRKAIGDSGVAQQLIRTVPRKGIRFVGAVREEQEPAEPIGVKSRPIESRAPITEVSEPRHPEIVAATRARGRHRLRGGIVAAVVAVLGLVAVAAAAWNWPATRFGDARPTPRLSIAVLPFSNLNGDQEPQYFADGITDDLITDLSRLAGMFVISRNTSFTYRNKPADARQIGYELGVRYLLEGSVRRSGEQLRVNAQLIDAETGAHLWAERFDRKIGELFTLQNDITSRIAVALNLELIGAEAARPTERSDALNYILRARAAMLKPPNPGSYAETITLFEHALELDPGSSEAQSMLSSVLASRVIEGMTNSPQADLARAEELASRAVASAPGSFFAHFARALVLRTQGRCADAVPEYETAIALNRNWVNAIAALGMCKVFTGSVDEAVPLLEEAIRLSPHDALIALWYNWVGRVHLLQSRTDEAIPWFERARQANPALLYVHSYLASAYALRGDTKRATAELTEARRLSTDDRYSSIARLSAAEYFGVPKSRALFEATYFAGLRKLGVPEE
jgi:TolB-like protein/DNA-binding winged helix-turn-helix (wHTH) protein/Flp pilus assembly protein TadD